MSTTTDGLTVVDQRTIARGTGAYDTFDAERAAASVSAVVDANHVTYVPYVPATGLGDYALSVVSGGSRLTWYGTHKPAAAVLYTVTYTCHASLLFKGVDFIKTAIVKCLRVAYTVQPFYTDFVYNASDVQTKISILPAWPNRVFKTPAIIVSVAPGGAMEPTHLAQNESIAIVEDEDGNPSSAVSSGGMGIPISIEIVSTRNSDICKLCDLTVLFLRTLFTWRLSNYGISFKNITIGGEDTAVINNQTYYKIAISFTCYTEYQVALPIALVDTINKTNFKLYDTESDLLLNEYDTPV